MLTLIRMEYLENLMFRNNAWINTTQLNMIKLVIQVFESFNNFPLQISLTTNYDEFFFLEIDHAVFISISAAPEDTSSEKPDTTEQN